MCLIRSSSSSSELSAVLLETDDCRQSLLQTMTSVRLLHIVYFFRLQVLLLGVIFRLLFCTVFCIGDHSKHFIL